MMLIQGLEISAPFKRDCHIHILDTLPGTSGEVIT